MAFFIKTAGQAFRIEPNHDNIRRYCEGYICEPCDDFCDVSVTPEEIEAERQGAIDAAVAEHRSTEFSKGQLEILTVHRKIAEFMPGVGVFLFHGSAVAVDGEAYIFTAKSGTGKSTHSALWRRKFGGRAVMVNDDKPFIMIKDGKAYACGSPWNGKHRSGSNVILPVKSVCLLCRGDTNEIYKISSRDALPTLFEQTYRPSSPDKLARTLGLLHGLTDSVGLYRLFCNMSPEAADVSYEAMKEGL